MSFLPPPALPLRGIRILVTRGRDQGEEDPAAPLPAGGTALLPSPAAGDPPLPGEPLVAALEALGATVLWLPVTRYGPPADLRALDAALARLAAGDYAWLLLTSARAVAVLDRVPIARAWPAGTRVAAVGPATARALAERGIRVDFVPAEHRASALAGSLPLEPGARLLFPKSQQAAPTIERGLAARGARVDAVVAYRGLPAARDPRAAAILAGRLDWAVFTAGSALEGLARQADRPLAQTLAGVRIACIGPETARAARAAGLAVDLVPPTPALPALAAALAAAGPVASGSPDADRHADPTPHEDRP